MATIAKVYKGAEQIWPGGAADAVVGFKGVRFSGAISGDNLEWTTDVGTTVDSTGTANYKVRYTSIPYNPVMPIIDTMNNTGNTVGAYNCASAYTGDPDLVFSQSRSGTATNTTAHTQLAVVAPEYGDDYRLETLIVDVDGNILYSDTPGWTVNRSTTAQFDCQAPEAWDMSQAVSTAYYPTATTYVYGVWTNIIQSTQTGYCRVRVYYATSSNINQPFYLGVLVANG